MNQLIRVWLECSDKLICVDACKLRFFSSWFGMDFVVGNERRWTRNFNGKVTPQMLQTKVSPFFLRLSARWDVLLVEKYNAYKCVSERSKHVSKLSRHIWYFHFLVLLLFSFLPITKTKLTDSWGSLRSQTFDEGYWDLSNSSGKAFCPFKRCCLAQVLNVWSPQPKLNCSSYLFCKSIISRQM